MQSFQGTGLDLSRISEKCNACMSIAISRGFVFETRRNARLYQGIGGYISETCRAGTSLQRAAVENNGQLSKFSLFLPKKTPNLPNDAIHPYRHPTGFYYPIGMTMYQHNYYGPLCEQNKMLLT